MRDAYDLPNNKQPITETGSNLEEEKLEEHSTELRQHAHDKLKQVREKLLQARKDLENTSTEIGFPKRNPFGRKTAALKQLADELQASPTPILSDSRGEPDEPSSFTFDVPLEFVDPDDSQLEINTTLSPEEKHESAEENPLKTE